MKCRVIPAPKVASIQVAKSSVRSPPGAPAQPVQALVDDLRLEVAEVVLERVRHPAVADAHVRRALVLVDVVAHRLLEQRVELAEVAEDDVAALVPCEAGCRRPPRTRGRRPRRSARRSPSRRSPSRSSSRAQPRPHGPAPTIAIVLGAPRAHGRAARGGPLGVDLDVAACSEAGGRCTCRTGRRS